MRVTVQCVKLGAYISIRPMTITVITDTVFVSVSVYGGNTVSGSYVEDFYEEKDFIFDTYHLSIVTESCLLRSVFASSS